MTARAGPEHRRTVARKPHAPARNNRLFCPTGQCETSDFSYPRGSAVGVEFFGGCERRVTARPGAKKLSIFPRSSFRYRTKGASHRPVEPIETEQTIPLPWWEILWPRNPKTPGTRTRTSSPDAPLFFSVLHLSWTVLTVDNYSGFPRPYRLAVVVYPEGAMC